MTEPNNFHTNAPRNDGKQSARSSFATGDVLAERYKIESVLGIGGMGVVYKVEQVFLRKIFAMKTLEIEDATGMFARRFQQEGSAVSRLDHPNVIRIHDFGLLNGITPFYVMDYINGISLSELLKRRGSLEISEALKIFTRVSMALKHAHDAGIVHRDIKPSNIMLQSDNFDNERCVKIVDFGIAKLKTEGNEVQNLTRTGDIFGSPLYMSPEQCLGIGVDHRTDIYSFGCALYEALTGSPPHVGENALSTMIKHREETAPSLSDGSLGKTFSPAIEAVVQKLLRKDPNERYQDFGDVAEDLASVANGKKPVFAQSEKQKGRQRQLAVGQSGGASAAGTASKDFGSKLWVVFPILALCALAYFCWYAMSPAPKPPVVAKPVSVVATTSATAINANTATSAASKPPESIEKTADDQDADETPISPEIQSLYDNHQIYTRSESDRMYDHTQKFSTECVTASGQKVRVFQFPHKGSLGKVEFGHKQYVARGDVLVTEQGQYNFTPNYACCERPSYLDSFRPDEIDELDLSHKESATDEVLSHIAGWTGLKVLNICTSEITDRGLKYLDNLPITDFRVSDTAITGKALAGMKILPQLKRLEANYVPDGSVLLKALRNSKGLTSLKCRYEKLTDADLINLKDITTLTELDFSENKQITDKGLQSLTLPNLRHLGIRQTRITAASFPFLKTLPKLRKVVVEEHYPEDLQIAFHQILPNVELSTDSGLQQVFRMIKD